jgi:hypothetical protein
MNKLYLLSEPFCKHHIVFKSELLHKSSESLFKLQCDNLTTPTSGCNYHINPNTNPLLYIVASDRHHKVKVLPNVHNINLKFLAVKLDRICSAITLQSFIDKS